MHWKVEDLKARVADPRAWLPSVLAATLVAVPVITWMGSVGNLVPYLYHQVPDGQLVYLVAKLAGLAALVLMSVQLAIGLSGLARVTAERNWYRVHRGLGIATFATVLLHAVLFASAASLRSHSLLLGYFWPDFSQGYYRSMIAVGALALIVLALAFIAAMLRGRFPRIAALLHRLVLPVYALVWIHSLTIGSESRMGLMPYVYGLLAMLVAAAFAYRIVVTAQRAKPKIGS